MVVSYLEKIREKYQREYIEINALLNETLNQQKENTEFIKVLEINDDPNFESFTPRQVNSFNKTKIAELKNSQKQLEEKINTYKEQLSSVEKELEEVALVIKTAKEMQSSC